MFLMKQDVLHGVSFDTTSHEYFCIRGSLMHIITSTGCFVKIHVCITYGQRKLQQRMELQQNFITSSADRHNAYELLT